MLTKLFALLLLAGSVLSASAQAQLNIEPVLYPAVPGSAGKTTALQSRLVAQSIYQYNINTSNFDFEDSTRYTYSGGRGGDLVQPMQYDTATSYDGQKNYMRNIVVYDANNNATKSYTQFINTSNLTWENVYSRTVHYNAANQPVSDTGYFWDINTMAYLPDTFHLYQYNTSGQLVTDDFYSPSQTANGTRSKITYSYNTDGTLANRLSQYADVQGSVATKISDTCTYNSNGQLVSVSSGVWAATMPNWILSNTIYYWYNANGSLRRQATMDIHTTQYDSSQLYEFTYDNNNDLVETVVQQYGTGNKFHALYHVIFTNNSVHQRISAQYQNWYISTNSWQNDLYNTYSHYYYEDYFPTSVAQMQQQGGQLNLYPVPANNTLNVAIGWDVPQTYTLTIADMQGRVNMQYITDSAKEAIDVSLLPAGAYNIILKGDKGGVQHSKFNIVR